MNYKGFAIIKTGRAAWDYRVDFGNRSRWGTIEELKRDIDLVDSGIGLPAPVRGYA